MVAGNTIVSFLFSFGVSLDAGLVAGSTSLTLSLSHSLSLSPLPLPAPPAAMQLSPSGLAAYTLPHTGLQPFLSLPYAGVYTLLDNSVQGRLGLSVCSWQPHQPSFLQFTRNGHFFSVSCSSSPFLPLPYAGVYTLLDNRVQGCLGLLLCSWQPHQPSSLKSHPTVGAELKILPPFGPSGRRVCVTLGIIGILLDFSGLPFCFVSQQGGCLPRRSDSPTKRLLWWY